MASVQLYNSPTQFAEFTDLKTALPKLYKPPTGFVEVQPTSPTF